MSERPLHQDAVVDEPGLVGARWWQDSVVDPIGRRKTILTLLAVGAGLGVAGLAIDACNPTKEGRRTSLDLQREYGWSFGAASENLVFNGQSTEPFDRDRLAQMVSELSPRVPSHRPFYVPTLFESPTALPKSVAQGDPTPIVPLKTALVPIFTNGMKDSFKRAQACADLLATAGAAMIVDLDGPDSVGFAAGACQAFNPVFLFDNWPHPHGVVPAHMTLAAAAYYQPMLARAAQTGRKDSPPMLVLDRQRLDAYTDNSDRFDNRWVARMPGVAALRSLGVRRLIYVAPSAHMPAEMDDLNDNLVADHAAAIGIVTFDLGSLNPTPGAAVPRGVDYVPVPRRTAFSSGVANGTRPSPPQFGTVAIAMSLVGGTLLGVAWSRSGSWNRGGGGWGGG